MTQTARLTVALLLTALLAIFECVGGFLAHSLALLSDAAHVATDVLALGIALAARISSQRPATRRQTFGFARMEVIAALVNGGFLFAITGALAVAAVHRLFAPELPAGRAMIVVAAIGLAINALIAALIMRSGADGGHVHAHAHGAHDHDHAHGEHDADPGINIRAALLHVAGDALGAVVVIVGGFAVLASRQAWIDPALSLFVSVILVVGVVRITREAVDVLLQSAPSHADVHTVHDHLRSLEGVVGVHDLHVWTLAGAQHVLSAHVLLDDRRISEASAILRRIEAAVRERYGITHVTLQFECEDCDDGERIVCAVPDRR